VYSQSKISICHNIVFKKVDFHAQFSQTIHIICFLYKCCSEIKNKGSFLHIKTSLKYSTFSGKSHENQNVKFGFLGI
jgi:hypothetical protein